MYSNRFAIFENYESSKITWGDQRNTHGECERMFPKEVLVLTSPGPSIEDYQGK